MKNENLYLSILSNFLANISSCHRGFIVCTVTSIPFPFNIIAFKFQFFPSWEPDVYPLTSSLFFPRFVRIPGLVQESSRKGGGVVVWVSDTMRGFGRSWQCVRRVLARFWWVADVDATAWTPFQLNWTSSVRVSSPTPISLTGVSTISWSTKEISWLSARMLLLSPINNLSFHACLVYPNLYYNSMWPSDLSRTSSPHHWLPWYPVTDPGFRITVPIASNIPIKNIPDSQTP